MNPRRATHYNLSPLLAKLEALLQNKIKPVPRVARVKKSLGHAATQPRTTILTRQKTPGRSPADEVLDAPAALPIPTVAPPKDKFMEMFRRRLNQASVSTCEASAVAPHDGAATHYVDELGALLNRSKTEYVAEKYRERFQADTPERLIADLYDEAEAFVKSLTQDQIDEAEQEVAARGVPDDEGELDSIADELVTRHGDQFRQTRHPTAR